MEIESMYNLLNCPVCNGNLSLNKNKTHLLCHRCHEAYPLKDGVPILIPANKREPDPELEYLRKLREMEGQ